MLFLFFICYGTKAQIANYVNNGSFEVFTDCSNPFGVYKSVYWNCIDTTQPMKAGQNLNTCFNSVPVTGAGYQYPKHGNGFIRVTNLCGQCQPLNSRIYPRNRLKAKLIAGEVYCVKYYVNVEDVSPLGCNNLEALFTDNSIDTIKYVNRPLTFLNPQITSSVIITDTMNWVPVTGTFTANGTEKYMILGNFKSDAATGTLVANGSASGSFAEHFVDYVSCIPLNLAAYAAPGPDIWGIPTTTVYLGRQQDVGIDEACMWYKLPNTTTAIDTAAGITITVAPTTETYMVKQDICGMIKYDTVVVHPSAVDIRQQQLNNRQINIFPNPASTQLSIVSSIAEEGLELTIKDMTGREVLHENLTTQDFIGNLDLSLVKGVYLVTIKSSRNESVTKKLVVAD